VVSQSVTSQVVHVQAAAAHSPVHPVAIGAPLVETFTVTNTGPDTTNATLTISFSGNFVLGPVTDTTGTGCSGTGPITCDLGTLAAGGQGSSSTVTVTLIPLVGHSITLQAVVATGVANLSNNTANDSVSVTFRPRAR